MGEEINLTVELVIKNGKLVTPAGILSASIIVDKGKIVSLTRVNEPRADKTIDAKGNYVLPGMIDMHVHLRDPGFPERENFESGTKAAAAGGVTTVIDMPNTVPSVVTVSALENKKKMASRKSHVDFALIGGAGEVGQATIQALAEHGVTGYKTFMIARFRELAADDYQMVKNFEAISRTGLPCLIHAENQDMVDRGIKEALEQGRTDPIAHCDFRPSLAEAEATQRTIMLAKQSCVHLHICHVSSKEAVDIIEYSKTQNRNVSGETSANYLLLSRDDMKEKGPYAKMDPPLRGIDDQKRLWKALNNGAIEVIASDHAPYTKEDKEKGWANIFDAPSGSVAVETTLPLMLNCVNKGLITLKKLVHVFSENPAKINKLYPRKGSLTIGADADMVIVDMKRPFKIDGDNLKTIQKTTPFQGYEGKGVPIKTILRGKLVYQEGENLSKPGYGEWLQPVKKH